MVAQIIADCIKRLGVDAKVLFKGGKLPVYDHETSLPFPDWNNTMMYGEVRRGISEHTTCAVIPQAVRLSASEYVEHVRPDSDSLPVLKNQTKAIVPEAIISQQALNFKSRHSWIHTTIFISPADLIYMAPVVNTNEYLCTKQSK